MIGVVWGGLCAHLLAVGLGLLVLRPFRLRLNWAERWAGAAACGLAMMTGLTHALTTTGLFRRGAVQILAILVILTALYLERRSDRGVPGAPWWAWLPAAPFLVWIVLWAVGPDATPPGQDAALTAAHQLILGFAPAPWDAGAAYAVPYMLGRHSAVALFHALLLAPLVGAAGRCGWLAMLLIAANPAMLNLGSHAGTGVAFSLSAFVCAGLAVIAFIERDRRYLIPSAVSAVAAWLSWPGPLHVFSGFVFLVSPWWLIPFFACLTAWFVRPVRSAAMLLGVFAAITGWPHATKLLVPPAARLPERTGFIEARFLEVVPTSAVVLADVVMPGAWVSRRLAPAEWLDHARKVAVARWGLRTFPYRADGRQELNPGGFLGEVLLFQQGREVPRDARWKVWPPDAFDGLPFTGATGPLRIDTGGDPVEVELRVIGDRGDSWIPASGLRRNVVLEWRRRGVTHALLRDPLLKSEFTNYAAYWGTRPIGERDGAWLYELK